MTQRQIGQPKERYVHLDDEINARKYSFGNYSNIKRAVISADATAQFALLHNHECVSATLGLSSRGRDEMHGLYTEVINPMNSELFEIRTRIIGQRTGLGLGTNISPIKKPTEEAKSSAMQQFSDHFAAILNDDALKDKQEIKAVIIYPLIIAQINTWRKYDNEFAGRLIEKIKSNEPVEYLKKIISIIEIPVFPARG